MSRWAGGLRRRRCRRTSVFRMWRRPLPTGSPEAASNGPPKPVAGSGDRGIASPPAAVSPPVDPLRVLPPKTSFVSDQEISSIRVLWRFTKRIHCAKASRPTLLMRQAMETLSLERLDVADSGVAAVQFDGHLHSWIYTPVERH